MKSIFITVRTGSTRLPNKCLLHIDGTPSIEYLIRRLKHSRNKDNIVLCTTEVTEDDILVDIAKQNKIDHYRGSEQDKLQRWRDAAEFFGTEFFVTADGDDPFCEPNLIDLAFDQYTRNDSSFIQATNIICGAFTYGISTDALLKVCDIKGSNDTEMILPYFIDTNLFQIEELEKVPSKYFRDNIRLTLDYEEDLLFMNTLANKGKLLNSDYINLDHILKIIDDDKEILKINGFRHQEWASNQQKNTKLILKDRDEHIEK